MSSNEYSHILIFAQQEEGRLSSATLQVLGKARELADQLGVYVIAVLIGEGCAALGPSLTAHGADRVLLADGRRFGSYDTIIYTELFSRVLETERPEIVLFAESPLSSDLAPRVAQRQMTGLVSGCVGLEIDTEERLLVCTRTYYGGRLAVEMVCPERRPQMAILKEGAFVEAFRDDFREGKVERLS